MSFCLEVNLPALLNLTPKLKELKSTASFIPWTKLHAKQMDVSTSKT